jgi:hypothetical protein
VAEHEPAARGGSQRAVIVDDDPVIAADAEFGHRAEIGGRRKHVGAGLVVGTVDVQKLAPGCAEVRRVAAVRRQEGAASAITTSGSAVARQPFGETRVSAELLHFPEATCVQGPQ